MLRLATISIALAVLLTGAPHALAQGAGEPVTLRYKFAAGDRWSFDEDMTVKLKFSVAAAGKDPETQEPTNHKIRKGEMVVLEAAGERLDAVRLRFGPECTETALAGQTVTVRRRGEGDAAVECAAALSDDEKKEARQALDPGEGFLPKKPVKVGDRWVANEKAIARSFDLGPNDRGTLRLTLKALRDVAGRRTAEVALELVLDQKLEFLTVTGDLEGTILIDVETGVGVGVDLHGPLTVSGETEQEGAKVTVDGGGELTYKSTSRRLAAETAGAPAPAPAPAPAATPPAPAAAGLPLRVPEGWESQTAEGALVIAPKDVPEGHTYTLVVPQLTAKVGSLRGLIDAGKAMLGELGTFKPANDPAGSRNEAGWEYEVVMGTVEKDGGAFVAQALGLRKGDEEGIILVLSDSVETMERYSDAFAAMIRTVGVAPGAAPAAPATPATPASAGRFGRMIFTPPPGWKATAYTNGVVLKPSDLREGSDLSMTILPSIAFTGTLGQGLERSWDDAATQLGCTKMRTVNGTAYEEKRSGTSFKGWEYARGEGGVRSPAGEYYMNVFVVKLNGRLERIAVASKEEGLYRRTAYTEPRYYDVVQAFLFSVQFDDWKEPELAPGTLKGDGIVGLWVGSVMMFHAGRGADGGGMRLTGIYAIFFSNGQAYFGKRFPEHGAGDGLDTWLEAELATRDWGTYKFENDQGVLSVTSHGEVPLRRDGAKLVVRTTNTDHKFEKLPSVDGTRFDGTWVFPGTAADGRPDASIAFTPGGQFRDEGAVNILNHQSTHVVAPGAGTYEVKDFTLALRFSDGRLFRVAFHGNGYRKGDPRPAKLTLSYNEDVLERK